MKDIGIGTARAARAPKLASRSGGETVDRIHQRVGGPDEGSVYNTFVNVEGGRLTSIIR